MPFALEQRDWSLSFTPGNVHGALALCSTTAQQGWVIRPTRCFQPSLEVIKPSRQAHNTGPSQYIRPSPDACSSPRQTNDQPGTRVWLLSHIARCTYTGSAACAVSVGGGVLPIYRPLVRAGNLLQWGMAGGARLRVCCSVAACWPAAYTSLVNALTVFAGHLSARQTCIVQKRAPALRACAHCMPAHTARGCWISRNDAFTSASSFTAH